MLLVDGVAIVLPRGARFQLLRPNHQKWLMLPMVLLSGLSFSLMLGPALIAGEPSRNLVAEMAVALMAVSIFGDRRLLGVSYFCGLLIASILHRTDFAQICLLISFLANRKSVWAGNSVSGT